MPQGSVLGPLLFLIYINDLEDSVASNIVKFAADDANILRIVQTRQECHTIQGYLNRLVQWSDKWQMLFNQNKCKCLHIGRANGKEPYEMHDTVLIKTSKVQSNKINSECLVLHCKLTTLETRRVRGDQYKFFKIAHG